MPLHRIYVPSNLYTVEDKANIAKAITNIYTKTIAVPLPAFYVSVIFIDVKEGDYFVGGERAATFVRFLVHHLARQFPSEERKLIFLNIYEDAIQPFTKDRGLDWEVSISDEDPKLWHENGFIPPHVVGDKAGEKLWVKENKAIPYSTELES